MVDMGDETNQNHSNVSGAHKAPSRAHRRCPQPASGWPEVQHLVQHIAESYAGEDGLLLGMELDVHRHRNPVFLQGHTAKHTNCSCMGW